MIVGKLYCSLRQDGESILAQPAVNSSAKENQRRWNAHHNDQFVLIYLQTELICSTVNARGPSKECSDWRYQSGIHNHTSAALQPREMGNPVRAAAHHSPNLHCNGPQVAM